MIVQFDQVPAFLLPSPRKAVLCHGCFDVLTYAHVRYLKAARKLGDVLWVSVTPDCYVAKGEGRPVFALAQRMEVLSNLKCVDFVVSSEHPTAVELIANLRPKIYAKGIEYQNNLTPGLRHEKEVVEANGGRLVFIDEHQYHSTDFLNLLDSRDGVLIGQRG